MSWPLKFATAWPMNRSRCSNEISPGFLPISWPFGPITTSVGQLTILNRSQMVMFSSLTTGCLIRYSATLRRMFSVFRSALNFPEWTPITTTSFLYFCSSLARTGRTWWQLMQQYVQKSSRTILPLSLARSIGPELIQPTPPSRLGTSSWLNETNCTRAGSTGWEPGKLRRMEGSTEEASYQRQTKKAAKEEGEGRGTAREKRTMHDENPHVGRSSRDDVTDDSA